MREQLESKMKLFEGHSEADRDFWNTMHDYLDFYDTKAKPALYDFTQKFKEAINALTEFLGLASSDQL